MVRNMEKTQKNQLFISLVLLTFLLLVQPVFAQTERDALISLYMATGGNSWGANSGWKESPVLEDGFNEDPCTAPLWYGVTCSSLQNSTTSEHTVTSINLEFNGLKGEIPTELGNLSNLEYLDMFTNQLMGEIPAELGNLSNLEYLDLNDNQLTGKIPASFINLTSLYDGGGLFLNGNHLYTDSNTLREFLNNKSSEPWKLGR